MRLVLRLGVLLGLGFVGLCGFVGCVQRRLLYFPSHENATAMAAEAAFRPWQIDGEYAGVARTVPNPRRIWFILHGNAGQAASRGYLLRRLNPADDAFILEYPGYGPRPGSPSKTAFDAAALEAWQALVRAYGVSRLTVLGESIGSGPAAELARAPIPPQRLVLVVPFDRLIDVAQEKFRFLPVGLIMLDRWDNIAALKHFTGRLDIFGGVDDPVIPVHHARRLAAAIPTARYHEFSGGHNWADFVDLSQF